MTNTNDQRILEMKKQIEVKKEKLFNSLNQKGLYTKTYEDFNNQFFPVKKKDFSEDGGLPSFDIPSKSDHLP